jgi:phosphomannomutase
MSSLKFGTSGLRGLVTELSDDICFAYTIAFLKHMQADQGISAANTLLVGYDLRASSPRIAAACVAAARHLGITVENCGALPTPALALRAQNTKSPAIMITGSHIPDDRNGLKFYRPDGEIDKRDEAAIVGLVVLKGNPAVFGATVPPANMAAGAAYLARCLALLQPHALSGKRIGVYQHSSVARDFMVELLTRLGAGTVPLGWSDVFVPVDTEALRPQDVAFSATAVKAHGLDALISTDGDADRPLLADENGVFLRGDTLGILTAQFLKADAVVTPVTSSTAVELCGSFPQIMRTKVGSPYVIEGMNEAARMGAKRVVGFEANGGVLLGSSIGDVAALPTRDAMLPILSVLGMAVAKGCAVSALVGALPSRFTASGRIEHVTSDVTSALLARLAVPANMSAYFDDLGPVASSDSIDGLRVGLNSGDVIHYRASGNAPELRCYAEAGTSQRAQELLAWGLKAAAASLKY